MVVTTERIGNYPYQGTGAVTLRKKKEEEGKEEQSPTIQLEVRSQLKKYKEAARKAHKASNGIRRSSMKEAAQSHPKVNQEAKPNIQKPGQLKTRGRRGEREYHSLTGSTTLST